MSNSNSVEEANKPYTVWLPIKLYIKMYHVLFLVNKKEKRKKKRKKNCCNVLHFIGKQHVCFVVCLF